MSLSEKTTDKLTPAERELDRYLRECWRPPVRLPGADGTHEPVEVELAVETLARHLGVTREQTLAFWAMIQKAARALATPAKLASVDFDPDREPTTIAEARNLQKYWRAKRAELERAVASGKLVLVEEAMEVFGKQIAEAKTAIMAIPQQLRIRIPRLTDADVAALEALCAECFEGVDRLTAKAARPSRPRKGRRS